MLRNNAAELLAAGYTYHSNAPRGLRQGGACSCGGACGGRSNERVDMDHPGYIRAALVSDDRSPFTPAHTDILAAMDTDTLRRLRDTYLGEPEAEDGPRANRTRVLAVNADDPGVKAMTAGAALHANRVAEGRPAGSGLDYSGPRVLRTHHEQVVMSQEPGVATVMAAARGYNVVDLLPGTGHANFGLPSASSTADDPVIKAMTSGASFLREERARLAKQSGGR
jgi:hypothetical protein